MYQIAVHVQRFWVLWMRIAKKQHTDQCFIAVLFIVMFSLLKNLKFVQSLIFRIPTVTKSANLNIQSIKVLVLNLTNTTSFIRVISLLWLGKHNHVTVVSYPVTVDTPCCIRNLVIKTHRKSWSVTNSSISSVFAHFVYSISSIKVYTEELDVLDQSLMLQQFIMSPKQCLEGHIG